jgi:CMP/dCMP kinase
MYRAVAWAALQRGVDVGDAAAVAALTRALVVVVGERVLVDGVDVTVAIRTHAVDSAVSAVAANPDVRKELVARQRAWVVAHGGGVVEGRDIGTVVLPDADVKVYLTAATTERAERRAAERSDGRSVAEVASHLERRDVLDSTRRSSPLPALEDAAPDAVVVDSTGRSAEDVLEEVLACL